MRAKSITDFRKNIAADLDQVVEDHVPLLITRANGKSPAVVMSLEDFSSWQETAYLLASPANKERLIESIAEAEEGKVVEVPLPE
ncbi:MAG TPA: type II toxin-antitoxin system prevent-host-death family antitoxin [Devosiaceae bacterium]|nr:type II toxin-antitoxin system prevent-host-death family antitoxin [Devosiaceae bacterium]